MTATRIPKPAVRVTTVDPDGTPHDDVFAYGTTDQAEKAAEGFARFGWEVSIGTI